MAEQTQFNTLLLNLMSQDNEIRQQAETAYDNIPAPTKLTLLLPSMRNNNLDASARELAGILLRRLLNQSFDEVYVTLPVEAQGELKQQLLLGIQEESSYVLCKKFCDVTAELGRKLLDDDGQSHWPELLQFLFQCAHSTDAKLREAALLIFMQVPGIFGNQQSQHLELIKQMMLQSLADKQQTRVQVAASKAFSSFILAHSEGEFSSVLKFMSECLEPYIMVVHDCSVDMDDSPLKSLVEIAERVPKFLRPKLTSIMQMCMKLLVAEESGDGIRQLAMEVFVTMSETAPAMMRKHSGKFLSQLTMTLLKLMCDVDDEEEWAKQDEIEEPDADCLNIAAESALDRLACSLGGKTVLPHVAQHLMTMLKSEDWKQRHAALMAISAVGEGCHVQMENSLNEIVNAVLQFLNDPHPRVRYAACNALGQMSSDFAPTFQKKFHEKVVAGLLHVLDDNAHARVQAHAGAALVNFSEECPKVILSTYLDAMLAKLDQVLNGKMKELMEKGTKLVLEQCVTTIAAVADTAEEKFVKYYDRFLPNLKSIIAHATSAELRMLRGKAIECLSLIGLAVGSERFMADASDVMQLLLAVQAEQVDLPEDDPQVSYMISAWARICKILGKQFEQYLPAVMGPVLKAAGLKPDMTVMNDDDIEALEDDDEWELITLGDQQVVGIRTAGLEEKATACQMLVCYARELKDGFVPYLEPVLKLMVPLLKFIFDDGVRTAAAEIMPCLLDCAAVNGEQYQMETFRFIYPELINALSIEPEKDVLYELLDSIAKCLSVVNKACLTEEELKALCEQLKAYFDEHFERCAERQEKRKDEDYDELVEEELEEEKDEDANILSKISDVIHSLFSLYKELLMPCFDAYLLEGVCKLLNKSAPGSTYHDRQWGMCIFDDVLEFTGQQSCRYQQHFLPSMIEMLSDKHCELRQAASFGVGNMAQFGGEQYAQTCAEVVPMLVAVIQHPDSRDVENTTATENCISAVTKICKYNSSAVNVNDIIPHWLTWLPVYEDSDETPHVYGYLCDLIELNHPLVVGDSNANVPKLMQIFAEVFHRQGLDKDSECAARIVNLIRHIQSNEALFAASVSLLSPEQSEALQSYMQHKSATPATSPTANTGAAAGDTATA